MLDKIKVRVTMWIYAGIYLKSRKKIFVKDNRHAETHNMFNVLTELSFLSSNNLIQMPYL